MKGVSDVVIVGGGISGASLAYALASEGLGVTVLEASVTYEDRVRGESMIPWGVQEARRLGVERILLEAGAHISPIWMQYGEGGAREIPVGMMVPGISGSLNLSHPKACQALIEAAEGAGATVVRGIRDVCLTPGRSVGVRFVAGAAHEMTAGLVVGADGRASSVRKQTAIRLERQEPISHISGLLVDGLQDLPDDHDVAVADGDVFFLVFHQGGGRARVYLISGLSGRHRFAGRDAAQKFLAACRRPSYPWASAVAESTPAGPCATYAGDDTWTATPYAQGVVLIGDAAGHNDPIIGQGLSIGLRDARIVRDLILAGARQPADFAPYGEERMGRMERLRLIADVIAVTQAEDADNRSARRAFFTEKMGAMDAQLFPLVVGAYAGPEIVPPDLLDPRILDRLRKG